ncbi:MAG: hypothetical protein LPK12_15675 [Rhodobacterales bacterium]|nr:hypothetical protein [Rhodobacterales bacterium]MDX5501377.1 hypothetical protein [Rhodobacterales bacterium]
MTRSPEYEPGLRTGHSRALNLLHQIAATADHAALHEAMLTREIGMERASRPPGAELRKRARLDSGGICPRRTVAPRNARND